VTGPAIHICGRCWLSREAAENEASDGEPPNKPMKLTVAFGARSLSAGRLASQRSKGAVMAEKKASTHYRIHELLAKRWSPYAFGDRKIPEKEVQPFIAAGDNFVLTRPGFGRCRRS
jgi:hypothetical protein